MSHGPEDSENYWPGYVDALTSMVQTLAFVMMLLSMAVFVLSQNVTKSAITAIAKAAKVDASSDTSVNELTQKVVEQIERQQAQHAAELVEAAKDHPAKPAQTPAAPPPVGDTSAAKEGISDKPAAPAANQVAAVRVERPDGALVRRGEQHREAAAAHKLLQLKFAGHNFRMEGEDANKLDNFVTDQKTTRDAAHFIVRSFAFTEKGAVSDARRLAYYRTLSVRANLMKRGVAAPNIEVAVVDTIEQAKDGVVDVIVQSAEK